MRVRALRPLVTPAGLPLLEGQVYDLPLPLAMDWLARRLVEPENPECTMRAPPAPRGGPYSEPTAHEKQTDNPPRRATPGPGRP